MDRSKRLCEALPFVTKAVNSEKVFHDEAGSIWTNLRRGLNDLKKSPEQLDNMELPETSTIHDVWEFTLDIMVKHPKYSRQILDATEMLLASERWANGFLEAKQKHRLSLWKLKATKGQEPSPVSLASRLIKNGVKVDDLIPDLALESGLDFVQELASTLKGDAKNEFDTSDLGAAYREAKAAQAPPRSPPLPEGASTEDLGELAATNQAQAASIEAAGTISPEKRPGCRKEIVDALLEVFHEAVEVTGKHLAPLLTGYAGEANIASSAGARLQELKHRQANLQAQLVIMGPCQVGKTSLTYALCGFAALPPAAPSMVTTKWVHTPSLVVPRMTMPEDLAKLLTGWSERLVRLPHATEIEVLSFHDYVEGVDSVATAIDACHRTVYRCRSLGVVSTEELAALSRSSMFLQVEVAFSALADLEEQLTDTGMLSLVDLPSPEKDTLWATQDLLTLYRSTLRDADGVLVVVDASKHEVPQWMGNMLRDVFKQDDCDFEERCSALQRSDAWIVANRIDQLPEFFCKDGSKELCKKVMERQYENFKDVIVDQEHVIPVAARLSSLAIYGKEKIQEKISQQLLSRLERQPWFAQACALLFGIRWVDQVKDLDQSKWRSSMRELMLLGQVTGPLANSVLKTAYVNMLPRSVARVMQELSQLAWSFCSALSCLEGTSSEIQVQTLSEVFTTYQEDVRQRILKRFREFAPKVEQAKELAERKCPPGGMTFDGPDATDLNQKFFEIMAREALAEYQPSYERSKVRCNEEVKEAHNKFLRTVDYYLTKDGLDPFTKQKLLMDAKNLNMNSVLGAVGSPVPDSKRDEFVAEQVKQVEPTVHRRLFHRTHRSYNVALDFATSFETELLELWHLAAEELLVKLCMEPIHQSFRKLRQEMEDFNKRPRRRSKDNGKCNVSFGPKLAEVLKEISTFNVLGIRSNDALSVNEVERCEKVCQQVQATLQKIR